VGVENAAGNRPWPGLLLVSLFGAYAVINFRKEYAAASALTAGSTAA
jgi:hypothetical protein